MVSNVFQLQLNKFINAKHLCLIASCITNTPTVIKIRKYQKKFIVAVFYALLLMTYENILILALGRYIFLITW